MESVSFTKQNLVNAKRGGIKNFIVISPKHSCTQIARRVPYRILRKGHAKKKGTVAGFTLISFTIQTHAVIDL